MNITFNFNSIEVLPKIEKQEIKSEIKKEIKPIKKPLIKKVNKKEVIKEVIKKKEVKKLTVKKEVKKVVIKKEIKNPIKKEVKKNQICFKGDCKYVDGRTFGITFSWNYNTMKDFLAVGDRIQSYVDSGRIATSEYSLLTDDNHLSWVYGHNPGIFSSWYRKRFHKIGNQFTVYDKNGKSKTYTLKEIYVNRFTGKPAVTDSSNRISGLLDTEAVVVQYCIGKDLYIMVGM